MLYLSVVELWKTTTYPFDRFWKKRTFLGGWIKSIVITVTQKQDESVHYHGHFVNVLLFFHAYSVIVLWSFIALLEYSNESSHKCKWSALLNYRTTTAWSVYNWNEIRVLTTRKNEFLDRFRCLLIHETRYNISLAVNVYK